MMYRVMRACGCSDLVSFSGSDKAWSEREALMKKLPCTKCHTKRLKEKVSAGVPSLTEMCLGK